MKKRTTEEWSWRVNQPVNRVWRHKAGYLDGCVITAHGIVSVYSQGGPGLASADVPSTNLQVVHDGRLHTRTLPRSYTQRGLVTLANRFAEEITRSNP
jgi:hypothetical protein